MTELTPFGGTRLTAQRRAIIDAIDRTQGTFTVDELAGTLGVSTRGQGSTATLYRAVAALERSRFIERVGYRHGASLYTRCHTPAHHHHIVCDGCGKTVPAECPIEAFAASSASAGFVLTRHEVTLYGLCPDCAREDVC